MMRANDPVFDERDEPAPPPAPMNRAEAIASIYRLIREHNLSMSDIVSVALEDDDEPLDFSQFKSVRPWQENT